MDTDVEAGADVDALRAEVGRLRAALQGAGQGVWDHDIASATVRYSDTWKTLRGYEPGDDVDALAGPWLDRLHPDDRERILEATARQDRGELDTNAFEYRERHRDGHWMWILSRGRPVEWFPDGRVARTLGTDTDISPLKNAEMALAEEKERLLVTLKSIGEGLICVDGDGCVTSFNPMAALLSGCGADDAIGSPLAAVLDLRTGDDQQASPDLVRQVLETGTVLTLADDTETVRRDGTRRHVSGSISPVTIGGVVAGLVVVFRDTTDEHDYKLRLHHAATHDPLTDLPNRVVFEAAVDRAIETERSAGSRHTLCILDLDRFKLVNDGAGHAAGDLVLKAVARKLSECCRSGDLVVRLGGDEFGLLLCNADEAAVAAVCERITGAIGALVFEFDGLPYRIGVSIGTARVVAEPEGASKLISTADAACYRAKAAGRGRWMSADQRQPSATFAYPPTAQAEAIAVHFARATNLSLIVISGEGRIEFANPAALGLFGYTEKEMIGQPITIIIPERMRGAHSGGLARVASGEKPNLSGKTVEVSALRKDGTEFPIEITLAVWRDGGTMFACGVIKDISERRERDNRLLRLARQDTITGLHNRHRLTELLKAEIAAGRPAAVALIGLDGLKDVNEIHGHGVGDSLLQAVGVRLPYLLGKDAVLARFGGDEFAVLLPNQGDPLHVAAEMAAILEAFSAPFDVGGHLIDLAACVGYALYPAHGRDDEEILASADFALYRAKAAGKRRCRMFDASMRSENAARRGLRDELLRALRRHELVMHYQPQVRLDGGEVFGIEALIRWQHPDRGLLMPGAFLPALDQTALALEIGWWTLDEACRQLSLFNAAGLRLKMGVNLFAAQMQSPHLCRKVSDAVARHRIDPGDLELEVTESIALHDDDRSFETLSALRALGVGIAFDDFGTGYASLSSLQRYPLTTLKIDRSFVKDIMAKPGDAAITKALITMSSDLGLLTIAEGIETAEQESALRALGCPAAQGYRYGKPMPAEALLAVLQPASHTARRIC